MKRFALTIALVVGLAACNATTTVTNDIAAVEVGYTEALRVGKIYTDLPRCGSQRAGGSKVCSDTATVARMSDYATKAHDAIVVARSNSGLISLAVSAVANFRASIPAVQ